jgi:short-subunit dehydrogenase
LKVVQIDLSNSEAIHNLFTQLDLEKLSPDILING